MIDLAISLLVGAGVVCGTHHSHSDRDGLALPTPLTPLGKAHHFPLSTHSSAGPLRAILLALLAGGVARFGLALLARARAAAQPEGLHGAACSPSSAQHFPWRRCLVRPSLLAYFLKQSGQSKVPCCSAASRCLFFRAADSERPPCASASASRFSAARRVPSRMPSMPRSAASTSSVERKPRERAATCVAVRSALLSLRMLLTMARLALEVVPRTWPFHHRAPSSENDSPGDAMKSRTGPRLAVCRLTAERRAVAAEMHARPSSAAFPRQTARCL